jgi:hypothetical protein
MEQFESSPELSRAEVLQEIHAIWQMNQSTGRMDSEAGDFTVLVRQVEDGELTPEAGIQQARALAASRQDGFSG